MVVYDSGLADRITSVGQDTTIRFLASSYGVSDDSVRTYVKMYGVYPLLYTKGDNENDIMIKLTEIERFLKIKKLSNVQ